MAFWNKLSDKKPISIESGNWDGLRSDNIFFANSTGTVFVGTCYQGVIDGSEFCDFVDQYDNEIFDVVYWADIPLFTEFHVKYDPVTFKPIKS